LANAIPSFRYLLRHPSAFLAFGFGSGLSPKMPGTVGTLAAVPLYWLLVQLPLWAYLVIVLCAFVAGIFWCERASSQLGVHDHGGIVWDEFVGFWITMIAVPLVWYWVLLGFVLFRLFDILKPWPIRWADKTLGGGFGIMIDDVLAGFAAAGCLQMAVYFWG
jgi:phosphatidylglycerophosphatase A